ncbi:hypothetical protein B0H19DRAFT_1303435 [Mycena capillaripes]|nr:hypothetical protein B0H19DRAFT_1303435 [Mycena capillaripes]
MPAIDEASLSNYPPRDLSQMEGNSPVYASPLEGNTAGVQAQSAKTGDEEVTINGELLEAILHQCARWEYVKLHILLSDLLPIEGSAPMLRQLEVQHLINFRFCDRPRFWDFPFPTSLLPWSQVTSLILVGKTPSECTPILEQTINLVHCELILFCGWPTPQPDIHLPRLDSLILGPYSSDNGPVTDYLHSFVVPALRRLQIPEKFLAPDPMYAMDKLGSFIPKSQCQLEELHITVCGSGQTVHKQFIHGKRFLQDPSHPRSHPGTCIVTGNYLIGVFRNLALANAVTRRSQRYRPIPWVLV